MRPHWNTARRGLSRSRQRRAGDTPAALGLLANYYLLDATVRSLQGLRHLHPRLRPVGAETLAPPLLIAAPPRSGTTLLHRILAADPRFVSPTLIETIIPARSARRLLDPSRPPFRAAARLADKWFSNFDAMHRTRLGEAEEDVFMMQHRLVGPALCLVTPYLDDLEDRWFPDDLDPSEQRLLMSSYATAIGHIMAGRGDRTLLLKNTYAAGTLGLLDQLWPGLRVINIVRHPFDTVPSSVRIMHRTVELRTGHRSDPSRPEWQALGRITMQYHRRLEAFEPQFGQRWMNIRFSDLVADPLQTVERVYDHFALDADPAAAQLAEAAGKASSYRSTGEAYTLERIGIERDEIVAALPDYFARWGFATDR